MQLAQIYIHLDKFSVGCLYLPSGTLKSRTFHWAFQIQILKHDRNFCRKPLQMQECFSRTSRTKISLILFQFFHNFRQYQKLRRLKKNSCKSYQRPGRPRLDLFNTNMTTKRLKNSTTIPKLIWQIIYVMPWPQNQLSNTKLWWKRKKMSSKWPKYAVNRKNLRKLYLQGNVQSNLDFVNFWVSTLCWQRGCLWQNQGFLFKLRLSKVMKSGCSIFCTSKHVLVNFE